MIRRPTATGFSPVGADTPVPSVEPHTGSVFPQNVTDRVGCLDHADILVGQIPIIGFVLDRLSTPKPRAESAFYALRIKTWFAPWHFCLPLKKCPLNL